MDAFVVWQDTASTMGELYLSDFICQHSVYVRLPMDDAGKEMEEIPEDCKDLPVIPYNCLFKLPVAALVDCIPCRTKTSRFGFEAFVSLPAKSFHLPEASCYIFSLWPI
jgi:hypothetical protein